jgi:hypothetical protein
MKSSNCVVVVLFKEIAAKQQHEQQTCDLFAKLCHYVVRSEFRNNFAILTALVYDPPKLPELT